MKAFLWVLGGLAAIAAVVVVTGALQWFTADIRGELKARELIKADGANRIAAYNSFFNDCSGIQAQEGRLDQFFNSLASAPENDKARIQTNIDGIQGLRSEAIAKYNTDARKEYTEGQFRDSDLPFQIPTGLYEKGDKHTSCGVN